MCTNFATNSSSRRRIPALVYFHGRVVAASQWTQCMEGRVELPVVQNSSLVRADLLESKRTE